MSDISFGPNSKVDPGKRKKGSTTKSKKSKDKLNGEQDEESKYFEESGKHSVKSSHGKTSSFVLR